MQNIRTPLPQPQGFMIMTDEWFNEFMYQIAVNKATLAPEVLVDLSNLLSPLQLSPGSLSPLPGFRFSPQPWGRDPYIHYAHSPHTFTTHIH